MRAHEILDGTSQREGSDCASRSSASGKLNELFDEPYDYSWDETGHKQWKGMFYTDDSSKVDFIAKFYNEWEVMFATEETLAVTGKGDQFRIFATIIEMIKEFISKVKPERVVFTADKADSASSRGRLYTRMVKRFSSDMGYDIEINEYSTSTEFVLTRKA